MNNHPTFLEILKYREHPSILVYTRYSRQFPPFYFCCNDESTIIKERKELSINKSSKKLQACQRLAIPLRENCMNIISI